MEKTLAPSTIWQNSNKWKQLITGSVIFYIIGNAFLPTLERKIFWGEFFTCVTAFLILKIHYGSQIYQKMIFFSVTIWMLLIPFYGLLISNLYWAHVFEPWYLVRHAVFFYYCVFFFFAFKYADVIVFYLKKCALFLFLTVPISAILLGKLQMGFSPLFGLMLMGLSQRQKGPFLFHLGFILSLLVFLFASGAGTNKLVFVFWAFFLLTNLIVPLWVKYIPKQINGFLIVIATLLIGIFSIKFISYFYELTSQLALLGETLAAMEPISQELGTDTSGLWRLVLWSHLYGRFLDFPWGVGIGTPLFEEWLDGFVALNFWKEGENYVQGAHNSFVTIIARLGIPALILFFIMFYASTRLTLKVFAKLGPHFFGTPAGRLLSGAFLAFISITIYANFNVTLESPLYAGMFWFSFGLFTKLFGDFLLELNPLDDGLKMILDKKKVK